MQPELDRGYVQRVRAAKLAGPAGPEVALFEIRIPGETVHLVCAAGLGVGILDETQRAVVRDAMRAAGRAATLGKTGHGPPEGAAAAGLFRVRARFEGASLVGVSLEAVELARDGRHVVAHATGHGRVLSLADGALASAPAGRSDLEARGARIAAELAGSEATGRRDALGRAIRKAAARLERRVAAVEGDLARIEAADGLAARARMFVAAASSAPRGVDRLHAVDWTTGEARAIELPLDPSRGAREQIDALFKRARRLKDGGRVARARLADAAAAVATLRSVLSELAAATDLEDLEARAHAAAPRDVRIAGGAAKAAPLQPRRRAGAQPRSLPYRTFLGASGARILVGRGATHNDTLSFRVARPHDLWLHARDTTGAHVVVALAKGASCPPDWLSEAAHLAAHFSDAREERLVDVIYTPRRYLRKPRGSAPGLVVVEREKVFVLRKDDRVLGRLLEAEVV